MSEDASSVSTTPHTPAVGRFLAMLMLGLFAGITWSVAGCLAIESKAIPVHSMVEVELKFMWLGALTMYIGAAAASAYRCWRTAGFAFGTALANTALAIYADALSNM